MVEVDPKVVGRFGMNVFCLWMNCVCVGMGVYELRRRVFLGKCNLLWEGVFCSLDSYIVNYQKRKAFRNVR